MTDTNAPVQKKPKASVSERSSPKTPTAKKPKKAATQKSPVKKIDAPSKAAAAAKTAEEPKDADPIFGYPATEAVPKARARSKKRKFAQTWDLAINLKGMNLKKPENRFNLEYALPAGRGKQVKVGVIVDSLAVEAKKLGVDLVITKQEIPGIVKNKKLLKKIANEIDWFYGEVSLMPLIGKSFGVVLGPRGKVPKPIPPKANLEALLKRAQMTVRVAVKDSPVIHLPVGTENMKDEDIIRNVEGVIGFVKEKLPKGVNSIKNVYLKLTMGAPVKVEVK